MSCTAIEQTMPSYHSPAILRKVEVANWRNHVIKIFSENSIFMAKNIFFSIIFAELIASRIPISMIRDPRTVRDGPLSSKFLFSILGKSLIKSEQDTFKESLVERIIV